MLTKIFTSGKFWLIAILASFVFIIITLILINYASLQSILLLANSSLWWKLKTFWGVFWDFSILSIYYKPWLFWPLTFIFGINVSLVWRHVGDKWRSAKSLSLSTVAFFFSLIGLGCSACGSVFLVSIIGISASTAIIKSLMWHGQEFMVIGFIIVVLSLIYQIRAIRRASICKIKN